MTRERIKDLLERYHSGNVTEDEKAFVESWYNHFMPPASGPDPEHLKHDQKESWDGLSSGINRHHYKLTWPRYAAAAAVILLFAAFGIYHFIPDKKNQEPNYTAKTVTRDIAPGTNKAILTLANGKTIDISDTKNGRIATQAGVEINKTSNGQLKYENSPAETSSAVAMNTISVPRGGKYQVVLADGTKVWLNAASSLTFPSAFPGSERVVELSG